MSEGTARSGRDSSVCVTVEHHKHWVRIRVDTRLQQQMAGSPTTGIQCVAKQRFDDGSHGTIAEIRRRILEGRESVQFH
jgi:hypothetical protein